MKQKFKLLLDNVIEPGYCVGCGVCVSLCNFKTIDIDFASNGQYEPRYIDESTCTSCGLCVKGCPFHSSNSNEDDIGFYKFSEKDSVKHRDETGYYLNCFVGYADEQTRLNGASGGALSHLLKWLFENKLIDRAITVEGTSDPEKLFQYTIVDSCDGVDRCARSAYYPVEISEVLKDAHQNQGVRYAVVALPCVLKGVENAKALFPRLNNSIIYTIGLVCGQTKSKKYTEYLVQNLGARRQDIESINFRKKILGIPANDFAFSVIDKAGCERCRLWTEGVSLIWGNDLFKQKSCYYCDDVFAECADAVFMDAWLNEYVTDSKGTSLVINRNKDFEDFFKENGYGDISVDKVIESQQGVLDNKRSYRDLYSKLAKENSSVVPQKRVFKGVSDVSKSSEKERLKKYQWAERSRVATPKEIESIILEVKRDMRRRVKLSFRLKVLLVKILRRIGLKR